MKPTYTVASWQELTEAISRSSDQLGCMLREELWFRGVSRNSHTLIPSLYRIKHQNLDQLEHDLFFEFLAKARTGEGHLSEWDVLFLMQHYRAPTRLLDWTGVLHVAVHFAVAYRRAEDTQDARLFLMNPYAWNAMHQNLDTRKDQPVDSSPRGANPGRDLVWPKFLGRDQGGQTYYDYGELLSKANGIYWQYPVALYPPQRDARLSAQRGYFTIQGTDCRALEEIAPDLIVAIDLTENAITEAREQLLFSGINEFTLFPDLEGLSRYLRFRYEIDGL